MEKKIKSQGTYTCHVQVGDTQGLVCLDYNTRDLGTQSFHYKLKTGLSCTENPILSYPNSPNISTNSNYC